MKQPKPPQFTVGEHVEYYRRGICYPSTVREDLGVIRGAGRRYQICTRTIDGWDGLEEGRLFTVAERHLVRAEE